MHTTSQEKTCSVVNEHVEMVLPSSVDIPVMVHDVVAGEICSEYGDDCFDSVSVASSSSESDGDSD